VFVITVQNLSLVQPENLSKNANCWYIVSSVQSASITTSGKANQQSIMYLREILLLSAAILFSGAQPTKILRVLEFLKCASIKPWTFYEHQ